MTTVTIILPTFNGASRGYIGSTIETVLKQTHTAYRLIIIDDGSTDSTLSLCQTYAKDPRVEVITQENRGLAAVRNRGISLTKTPFICFLDDDDRWAPEKLQIQLAYFEKKPELGMVYTAVNTIDETGKITGKNIQPVPDNAYEALFFGNYVTAPSSVMIRTTVLNKTGNFREFLKSSEDYDLWIRIAKEFPIAMINNPLVDYRIHSNRMSSNLEKMKYFESMVLDLALEEAPPEIRCKKGEIFQQYYFRYASQLIERGAFQQFRTFCNLAAHYKPLPFLWKMKKWLSYSPTLFRLARRIAT